MATLPPIEQISYEEGSGGYQRPCSATLALTSRLSRPGCTTAVRVRVSTEISRIRSVEIVIAPSCAVEPPERPVPAPRVMIGMPWAAAMRTAVCTCSVVVGRTRASGVPACGSFARS